MATFAYSAINAEGAEFDGTLSAVDLSAAMDQLRQRGLLADMLRQIDDSASVEGNVSRKSKPVKPKSRQFATMIDSGLNVVSSLVILEQQTTDTALADVIVLLRDDVERGKLLSEAMAEHPKVFSRLYVAMVEAGEAAGILDLVLDRVAVQIEKEENIKRRVKGAMIYPTVVLTFATVVLFGMLFFLVPIFEQIFATLHGQLPMLTQVVVDVSRTLRHYWYVIIPLFLSMPFVFRWWKGTESGRR